jgi:excisionase family DNA binding protein
MVRYRSRKHRDVAVLVADLPDLASPAQVAKLVGVLPATVRVWIRQGRLFALKTCRTQTGRYRIPKASVLELLRGMRSDHGD